MVASMRNICLALVISFLISAEAAINNYNYNNNQQLQLQQQHQQQQQLQQQQLLQQQQQQSQFGGFNAGYGPTIGPAIVTVGPIGDKNKPLKPLKPHRPLEGDTDNQVLDRFSHRFPDGSYEFRYELADGSARYERGYFLLIDKVKTLVVVGYYSYRAPDGRYITVFYNADQNGYRQNQSITPQVYPNLPRSIDVPLLKDQPEGPTTPFTRVTPTTTHRDDHF